MNGNKTLAALAVVAMLAICAAPLAYEEADAADTRENRVSVAYLWVGIATIPSDPWYYSNYLYFIDGSENHAKMLAYIEDPTSVSITEDDKEILHLNVGKTAYVYRTMWYNYTDSSMNIFGVETSLRKVMDPYNNTSFIATSGTEVTIGLKSISTQSGEDTAIYVAKLGLSSTLSTITVGSTYSFQANSTGSYGLSYNGYENGDLYIDMTYTVEGDSEPAGSASAFVAVCFVITAISVGLVVLASLKPKWSK